jgi:hypothetical protein
MEYDNTKYKVWTWKNPMMLHWILNPGLAINELILGQRIPKVTLIDKDSTKTLAERTIIPCLHCGTMHSGLKWTPQNNTAFRNWFGLYCDNCEKVIPCLTNLMSFILLGLTFPIWFWFRETWRKKWIEVQKVKFSKPLNLTQPEFKWWFVGLRFGLFMYIFMTVVFPFIVGEKIIKENLLIGIPVWTIAGLTFGYIMKLISGKRNIKTATT